jgi:beta-lactamase regulating signal transducer with metallopeptidase domain
MSAYFDTILFFVNLAFNLLLFGCMITVGVAVSFRLIKNANPRLRYVAVVAAFLFAAFLPLAVTFNGSANFNDSVEAKNSDDTYLTDDSFSVQTLTVAQETASINSEPKKNSTDFINGFTVAVADSPIGKILFSLWILGAIGFIVRDIAAFRQLRKVRKSWREANYSEREELDFHNGIPLYFGAESPATIGFFYPFVVLPEDFPDNLSPASKSYIVQHELSHAHWRDPLVSFVLRLIRAVFWISPALWMLERIAAGERESAADHAAIAKFSENESQYEETALNYATTLVSMAKHFNFYARRKSPATNTIGLYNGSILKNRVRRLLARSSKPTVLRISSATMIFVASFAGLFFMPIAFQSEKMNLQTQAAVTAYSEEKELAKNEISNDLPVASPQKKLPPHLIKIIENNGNERTVVARQNVNKPESYLTAVKEDSQYPRVVWTNRQSPKNSRNDTDDDSEDSMRRRSEEDAKAAGLNQKLDELGGKVQGLDALRKDLGSDIQQVRQKAASQIDSLMRRMPPVADSGQKSN